jgi:hypothetical protein
MVLSEKRPARMAFAKFVANEKKEQQENKSIQVLKSGCHHLVEMKTTRKNTSTTRDNLMRNV